MMKRFTLIAFLLLSLLAFGAQAAIAVGGSDCNLITTGAATNTTSAITTQTTGSTFIAYTINYGDNNVSTVADNKGNPNYTRIGTELDNTSDGAFSGLWICENCAGGASHTLTLTLAGSAASVVCLIEITGGLTSGIADGNNAVVDAESPYDAAVTPTSGNRLLIACITVNAEAPTVTYDGSGGGFTAVDAVTDGTVTLATQCAQRAVTANGSTAYGPAFTASAGNRANVMTVALQEAGGGGSPNVRAIFRHLRQMKQ